MSTRHISHLIATVALAGATVAGCGGGDEPASTATATATPAATATATATPTPAEAHAKDAHPPPGETATPTPTATATPAEDAPGGGGDETEARVPVELTIQPDGQIAPATVSIPAFLAIELVVHNRTGATIAVTFQGSTLEVGSGATARRRLEGLRKGRYTVQAEGAGSATVVAGVEPGP